MKRRVICFFVLVFWGLVLCTILSDSIERQMTAWVAVIKAGNGMQEELKLPEDAVFYDDGETHLYEVVKGNNWEEGKRVQEVQVYRIKEGDILVSAFTEYGYIRYASKEIAPGDLVQTVRQYKGQEDNYLVLGKDEAILLSAAGEQPYMEEQVRSALSLPDECRIYSMKEVCAFFENLPLISALMVLMIMLAALWGYSCSLSRHLRKNRFLLMGNFVIGIGLTGVFWRITQAVRLPSSLLPERNILELHYYVDEFSEILGALSGLPDSAARNVMGVFWRGILLGGGILPAGLIWITAVLLLEKRMKLR